MWGFSGKNLPLLSPAGLIINYLLVSSVCYFCGLDLHY